MECHEDSVVESCAMGVAGTRPAAPNAAKESTAKSRLKTTFILVVVLKSFIAKKEQVN